MEESWTDALVNPRSIEAFYGTPPKLEDFHLTELRLDERGPSFFFTGEFSQFPDFPSPAWDDDAYSVRVEFTLSMVEEFEAKGRCAGVNVALNIRRSDDGFGVEIRGVGESLEFFVKGMSLQLTGMEPQVVAKVRMNL